jgi:phosphatidylglycerophosphate synthase
MICANWRELVTDTERSGCHGVKRVAAYQPVSRRPIAEVFRLTTRGTVKICVDLGIHPDLISYTSLVAAAAAGACFWQAQSLPVLLVPAVLFCYLRLWLNMLDGMVALASGKASRKGEIVNDLPDRVSDAIIFVGAAHSGLCHPLGGYAVTIFALLVAYVGLSGQAVGAQREFGGLMAKPWRMVVLHAGAWITLGLLWWGEGKIRYGGLTVLDWSFVVIIAGCVQTIWLRLGRILHALRALERAAQDSR